MDLIANARSSRRGWVVVALAIALLLTAAVSGSRLLASSDAQAAPLAEDPLPAPTATTAPTTSAGPPTAIKNIVFILADDLDTETFEQVARLKSLHKDGLTLTNLVATESLCCPSRTSILRSQYVHNHGVLSNLVYSQGGWATFAEKGEEEDCLPVWLHAAGVNTAFLGKYLNGYGEDGDPTAIPAGWDRWFVPTTKSGMYRGYGYTVNDDGKLASYANRKSDFLNDVLTHEAVDFISTAKSPFYLQVNSTAPHHPAPVAARHAGSHKNTKIPRAKSFNVEGKNAVPWLARKPHISASRVAKYDAYWRERVQSTESIADTVVAVRNALRKAGTLNSTLIVVSSDNGFHALNHKLTPGKRTPYKEDTVVPTILIGPGITPGSTSSAMTSTIDLGPTFAELLGAQVPDWTDGRSLVPLLANPSARLRTGVLTESLGDTAFNDPDFQAFKTPNYYALRTEKWLYVEYKNGVRELFNLQKDRAEIDNVVDSTPAAVVAELSSHLKALATCTGETCRTADTWTDGSPIAADLATTGPTATPTQSPVPQ